MTSPAESDRLLNRARWQNLRMMVVFSAVQ